MIITIVKIVVKIESEKKSSAYVPKSSIQKISLFGNEKQLI